MFKYSARMKYLLALLCFSIAASPFPTNSPSLGYQFVTAFPGVSTSDPYAPQFIGTSGQRVYWTSRDQKVGIITNLSSPTRTMLLDNQSKAFAMQDSGMPSLIQHPTVTNRWFSFASERELVTNGAAITTNIWDTLREWRPGATGRLQPYAVMIRQIDRSSEHLGGAMLFGNDGYLYATLSDEGGQGDPYLNSQRIDGNLFGGVMRIDVDGRPGNLPPNPHQSVVGQYWVPADNPFIGATNFNGSPVDPSKVRTEFWMVGLRNPNTMQIDRPTGRIFIGDVGGILWESVQEVVRGGNAGWAATEGPWLTTFQTGSPTVTRPPQGYLPPLWTYPHPNVVVGWNPQFHGNCVFVGPVVRGSRYPELDGSLIVSDINGAVWAIKLGASNTVTRIATHPNYVSGWAVDPATGDLLAASFGGKSITRMVRATPASIPPTLSTTGLFSDLATLTPAQATPYNVAETFWSDGAEKHRWALLPAGGKISRDSDDNWTVPAGTVMAKHFDVDGIRTETRVTVKTADGAYGLSYRWRADGSDADLASPIGEDVVLPGRTWHIPGWQDCTQCHTALQGFNPGFRTAQIHVGTQIEAMNAAGWFAQPLTNPQPALSTLSASPIQWRLKSYLDANCAHCHQPGGQGRGNWDARITVPLGLSGIVDGEVSDTLGIAGARVIAPGEPDKSIMLRRVADHTESGLSIYHMPPLGTALINTNGAALLEEFVEWSRPRTVWAIGTNGPSGTPYGEFSVENRLNDPAPGKVTRLAGDPLYVAGTNPTADDDFYTAGEYPVGFNGLTNHLVVFWDEPSAAWERALTNGDKTNRLHLVTSAGPATLTVAVNRGGGVTNGVSMPVVSHDIVITHRTQSSAATIWSGTINGNVTLSVPFTATDGPQTIEFVRTGPMASGSSYWMLFDALRITR